MAMRNACPNCYKVYNVDESMAGKKVMCSACNKPFRLQGSAPALELPPPLPPKRQTAEPLPIELQSIEPSYDVVLAPASASPARRQRSYRLLLGLAATLLLLVGGGIAGFLYLRSGGPGPSTGEQAYENLSHATVIIFSPDFKGWGSGASSTRVGGSCSRTITSCRTMARCRSPFR